MKAAERTQRPAQKTCISKHSGPQQLALGQTSNSVQVLVAQAGHMLEGTEPGSVTWQYSSATVSCCWYSVLSGGATTLHKADGCCRAASRSSAKRRERIFTSAIYATSFPITYTTASTTCHLFTSQVCQQQALLTHRTLQSCFTAHSAAL